MPFERTIESTATRVFLVGPTGHEGRKNDIPSFVFTMIKALAPAFCATLAFLVNVQSPLHVRAACPLN